ncbi:hypothetical protein [Oceanirhabdus seepicola]|uniref:Uncharacterized protein n=1 Tax=Oceanirhabdus seepicola TaxID=2828781 RepID=A0A9J6P074_9CLOT|nr:hypothetical protein [Oceanirhabdus seepicola]MCM1988824.1 hypothetical protein [Oceanirhabdus seepicola]
MLLIKKINETGKLINAKEEISDMKREITTYEYTNKYLKKNLELIRHYRDSVIGLNKLDSNIFPKEDISELISKIDDILKKRRRGHILRDQDFKYIVACIEGKSNKLRNEWVIYANENTKEIINSLNSLSNLFEDKRKVNEILTRLNGMKNRWPITDNDILEFREVIKEGQNIIEQLKLTEEVQMFLRMVVNRTATIEDLTPEVLSWIKDNGFVEKLTIGFK